MASAYYPDSNDNRADWWQNIIDNGAVPLTQLGFADSQREDVLNDAAWGVYLYRTLRVAFEEATKRVTGYANTLTDGPNGAPQPVAPVMPAWPTPPGNGVSCGIEARRMQWVAQAKSNAAYNPQTQGAVLRIEAPVTPFNPSGYKASLSDLSCPAARQVRFKFAKARGNIDGINLYGRKAGAGSWTPLGRFTAVPGNAAVPLAANAPEEWEFQSRAVKRDVEIGDASDIATQVIRG